MNDTPCFVAMYLCFLVHQGDLLRADAKVTPNYTPLGADRAHALLGQIKDGSQLVIETRVFPSQRKYLYRKEVLVYVY